jgi:hypothetical protein
MAAMNKGSGTEIQNPWAPMSSEEEYASFLLEIFRSGLPDGFVKFKNIMQDLCKEDERFYTDEEIEQGMADGLLRVAKKGIIAYINEEEGGYLILPDSQADIERIRAMPQVAEFMKATRGDQ